MSADKAKKLDYQPLGSSAGNGGVKNGDQATLKPSQKTSRNIFPKENPIIVNKNAEKITTPPEPVSEVITQPEIVSAAVKDSIIEPEKSYAEQQKFRKGSKKIEKDKALLESDRWINRNGHSLTYAGIFLFTFVLYFRPYELIPALSGLNSIAFILAVATLLIYLPTQLSSEGSLTILSTEVKCILFIAFWALLTMPLAKSPELRGKLLTIHLTK